MASLDNANPTIHSAPSTSSGIFGQASRRAGGGSGGQRTVRDLWAEEGAADFCEEDLQDGEQRSGAGEEDQGDDIDAEEIFDLLRSITDPEHPLTLEQLAVVSSAQISFPHKNQLLVEFTPTIPHCSMATLIGLSLRVRLLRALPERYKVDIRVKQGSHQSETAVNKQLNDKERVAAALENTHLLGVVEGCLSTAGRRGGLPVA